MSPGHLGSPSLIPPTLRELRHVAGRHWIGAYRNVVVCYWAETSTPEELRNLRVIYRALATEQTTQVSVLHYVQQGAGLPVPDMRGEFVSKSEQEMVSLACVGVVLAGTGFWVSALSSFIVGVRMLLPKATMPFRVSRDLEDMKPWFVGEHQRVTGERIDRSALDAWIEQARTALASPTVS